MKEKDKELAPGDCFPPDEIEAGIVEAKGPVKCTADGKDSSPGWVKDGYECGQDGTWHKVHK